MIITAKHHDGFCLWPSRFTEHSVASSKWRGGKGDVIKDLAEACRENGLWLGIYISPWDRNNPIYGKDDAAYNDYYVGQMEELLAGYGPIAEVWWDGANGDRNDPEKHQDYDWLRFIKTVRRLQPGAVIFAPPYTPGDLRWVGNEDGYANATQWCTYPANVEEDPTTLNVGIEGAGTWMPAETDVSIRPGWYWTHATDNRVKSVEKLLDIYYNSVGHNTNLVLNIPVDDRGLVHENDAQRLRELSRVLRATFATDLAAGRSATATNVRGGSDKYTANKLTDSAPTTYWATDDGVTSASVEVDLGSPTVFNRVVVQEHIDLGQRVRSWSLEARVDGRWQSVFEGTTIGHKCIARFSTVTADALRLNIRDSLACPVIESLSVYAAPAEITIRPRDETFLNETTVELEADQPGCEIYYTLDGSDPTLESPRYTSAFTVDKSCIVRAVVARHGELFPQVAEKQLVGYTAASLRKPIDLTAPGSAGVRVLKCNGGWQTLDQMKERVPVEEARAAGFDLGQRLTNEHTALAFESWLQVPADGVYQMTLESDDGSRLYIGNELVVDNDGLHGITAKSGRVGLRAGLHPTRVEWFNATSGTGLAVKWSGPGFEEQPIPQSALFLPVTTGQQDRIQSQK